MDDHVLFRKGLTAALNDLRADWTFDEASNGSDALDILREGPFDIALIDVQMPVMGGIEFVRRIKLFHPGLPFIVLTQFDEQSLIQHFLRMGANGFLCKNSDPKELMEAIEIILECGHYMNDAMIRAIEGSEGATVSNRVRLDLSARDKEIIGLLRQGKNSKQIASLLHLSETSIESYRKDLLHKTQTRNVAELISLTYRTGIL